MGCLESRHEAADDVSMQEHQGTCPSAESAEKLKALAKEKADTPATAVEPSSSGPFSSSSGSSSTPPAENAFEAKLRTDSNICVYGLKPQGEVVYIILRATHLEIEYVQGMCYPAGLLAALVGDDGIGLYRLLQKELAFLYANDFQELKALFHNSFLPMFQHMELHVHFEEIGLDSSLLFDIVFLKWCLIVFVNVETMDVTTSIISDIIDAPCRAASVRPQELISELLVASALGLLGQYELQLLRTTSNIGDVCLIFQTLICDPRESDPRHAQASVTLCEQVLHQINSASCTEVMQQFSSGATTVPSSRRLSFSSQASQDTVVSTALRQIELVHIDDDDPQKFMDAVLDEDDLARQLWAMKIGSFLICFVTSPAPAKWHTQAGVVRFGVGEAACIAESIHQKLQAERVCSAAGGPAGVAAVVASDCDANEAASASSEAGSSSGASRKAALKEEAAQEAPIDSPETGEAEAAIDPSEAHKEVAPIAPYEAHGEDAVIDSSEVVSGIGTQQEAATAAAVASSTSAASKSAYEEEALDSSDAAALVVSGSGAEHEAVSTGADSSGAMCEITYGEEAVIIDRPRVPKKVWVRIRGLRYPIVLPRMDRERFTVMLDDYQRAQVIAVSDSRGVGNVESLFAALRSEVPTASDLPSVVRALKCPTVCNEAGAVFPDLTAIEQSLVLHTDTLSIQAMVAAMPFKSRAALLQGILVLQFTPACAAALCDAIQTAISTISASGHDSYLEKKLGSSKVHDCLAMLSQEWLLRRMQNFSIATIARMLLGIQALEAQQKVHAAFTKVIAQAAATAAAGHCLCGSSRLLVPVGLGSGCVMVSSGGIERASVLIGRDDKPPGLTAQAYAQVIAAALKAQVVNPDDTLSAGSIAFEGSFGLILQGYDGERARDSWNKATCPIHDSFGADIKLVSTEVVFEHMVHRGVLSKRQPLRNTVGLQDVFVDVIQENHPPNIHVQDLARQTMRVKSIAESAAQAFGTRVLVDKTNVAMSLHTSVYYHGGDAAGAALALERLAEAEGLRVQAVARKRPAAAISQEHQETNMGTGSLPSRALRPFNIEAKP